MSTQNQNTAVIPARPKALAVMAARINVEPEKLMGALQSTCFKGASPEEMLALVVVANEYGLNPFLKQIYAFPKKGGGIEPMVPIDGWVRIITTNPTFDGVEFDMQFDEDDKPTQCTCTIFIKERSRPVKVTEYFEECFRNTEPWKNMPRRMLRHKALMQCGRVAFGLSGISDQDEVIDIEATVTQEPRKGAKAIAQPPKETAPADGSDLGPSTVRAEFQKLLDENGIDFATLQVWGEESGNIPQATSYASLEDVAESVLTRLLRSPAGLVKGLKAAKGQTVNA